MEKMQKVGKMWGSGITSLSIIIAARIVISILCSAQRITHKWLCYSTSYRAAFSYQHYLDRTTTIESII
jgi:hypothetical protein